MQCNTQDVAAVLGYAEHAPPPPPPPENIMTDPASAGHEPATTDLDFIITHALAERGDGEAATPAGAESFTAATASDASASEPARCTIRRPVDGGRDCIADAADRAAGALDAGQEGLVRDLAARRVGSCRRAERRARGRLHAQDPGRRRAAENCRASSESDQAVRSLFERARADHRSDPRHDDREPARHRIPASQRRSAEEGAGPS